MMVLMIVGILGLFSVQTYEKYMEETRDGQINYKGGSGSII